MIQVFFNDSGLDPDDFDYKQDYVYTRETQKEILLGGQTLRYYTKLHKYIKKYYFKYIDTVRKWCSTFI